MAYQKGTKPTFQCEHILSGSGISSALHNLAKNLTFLLRAINLSHRNSVDQEMKNNYEK